MVIGFLMFLSEEFYSLIRINLRVDNLILEIRLSLTITLQTFPEYGESPCFIDKHSGAENKINP